MKAGVLWGLASTAVAAIGTLLMTPYAIERIGVEQFGVLLLILAVSSYASSLDLGLTWAAARYFSADLARGDAGALAARFWTISCCFLAAGVAVVVIGAALAPGDLTAVVALAACSFAVSLQMGLLNALLQAGQWFSEAGRVVFLLSVLTPIAAYTALLVRPELTMLVIAGLLVNLIGAGFQATLAYRRRPFAMHQLRWEATRLREMLGFGGWSSFGKAITMIMMHLDRVAVAALGSIAGVTYYATPANLAARVNLLGGLTTGQYFAAASRLHSRGERDALVHHHARARRFLICGTLAIAVPLAILGPGFLEVWLGPEMSAAGGSVLVLLTIGNAVVAITCIDAAVLEASGRPHVTAVATGVWAVVAGAVAAVLLPSLGVAAIALAVAIWLGGVGATVAAFARRYVLGHDGAPTLAMRGAAIGAAVAVLSAIFLSEFSTVFAALRSMAISGAAVLTLGFLVILLPEDRRVLFSRS